jgi:DNA-binding transcriptional LysR family regulator
MALEQRVQAQLFHRTTRTVRLTDTGRIFFERCERMSQERDEAIAAIGEFGEPQGELRVTCSIAMGERFVSPIIRKFAMDFPKLVVNIDLSNRVIDLVAEGYDLAVRTGPIADARLISRQIASRTLYSCAAPAYIARHGFPSCVEDLARHECIVGTSSVWHFAVDGQELLHRPLGRFHCNSGSAVLEACLSGLGICQLPEFYILPHLSENALCLILQEFQAPDEPISAVYPQRRHLLPKVQQVVDRLSAELAGVMTKPRSVRV